MTTKFFGLFSGWLLTLSVIISVVSGRRPINLGFERYVEVRWIPLICILSYILFFQRQNLYLRFSTLKSLKVLTFLFVSFYCYIIANSFVVSRKTEITFLLFSDLIYLILLGASLFLVIDIRNKLIYFWSNFVAIGFLLSIGAMIFDKTENNGPGKIILMSSITFSRILAISVLASLVLIKIFRGKKVVVYLRFIYAFLIYSIFNTYNFATVLSLLIVFILQIIYLVTIENKKELNRFLL